MTAIQTITDEVLAWALWYRARGRGKPRTIAEMREWVSTRPRDERRIMLAHSAELEPFLDRAYMRAAKRLGPEVLDQGLF